jgi:DNA-binding NarL/FixJ family response regulator
MASSLDANGHDLAMARASRERFLSRAIKVLLVDDQPLVRAGLARILGPDDFEVVGECSDGNEVSAAVERAQPDVVLMDARMKVVDGAEATRRLRAGPHSPPVLMITSFDDHETVALSLSAGANGFILKDARCEDLIRATKTVARGGAWLDAGVASQVMTAYRAIALAAVAGMQGGIDDLTERELAVLQLVGRGASNSEIADHLVISGSTVKSHVGHIFAKLGLRDRSAAIVYAFDHGLVQRQV